ncbi:TauD/TfdA family dioxygenase [Hwanghaeella grinnelliae]|uniref:TauD/TfdA family dioxygenase n=1 Tax=Hwanghaeella grinnelliae TaxID=2500179 RepID=UPI0013871630|nr:TauD/TfdA family dioxygenase [Hwanghaeella grinnelliae]
MSISALNHDALFLTVDWADAPPSRHALIWLRDHDPMGFHPETGERVFDLLSVPEEPHLVDSSVVEDGQAVTLTWEDGHVTRFDSDFLRKQFLEKGRRAAAPIVPESWDGRFGERLPRHDHDAIMQDDRALLAWLEDITCLGLTVVENTPPVVGSLETLCRRIAHLRETNFGTVFEVFSKPNPTNQAYTADALPLHTDQSNQETPPGFQFLHTLRNEAEGGVSIFADGIRMAEDLRDRNPDAYRLLRDVKIPSRYFDDDWDIRFSRPVLAEDARGEPVEVNWNRHLTDVFDMDPEESIAYYRAYRAFLALTYDPHYRFELKSRPGDVFAFNNRRTLHGRTKFDPNTGARHLRGCYVDWTDMMGRIRVLQNRHGKA